jgi:hypothetical protein
MAWSRVQSITAGPSGSHVTTLTATLSTTPITGNKIIVYVGVGSPQPSSITVADGNAVALTAITTLVEAPSFSASQVFCYDVPATPSKVFTATLTSADVSMLVQEISGLASGTTGALDATATNVTGTAAPPFTGPAYTTSAANEYLAGVYVDDGNGVNMVVPSGYTPDANNLNNSGDQDLVVAYKNSTGGPETTGPWTDVGGPTANYVIFALAFQLAGAGSPAYYPFPQPNPVPTRRAANW